VLRERRLGPGDRRARHPRHPVRLPALEDLQATALQVVEEIGYGREITDKHPQVRDRADLQPAAGTVGRFLQGGHPLDFAPMHSRF
jgi:uncharacterized protein